MTEQQTAPHAEAVEALVAERFGQLVGYARKRLRAFDVPPAWLDAEDVVQNALASVLARSEPVEMLRPYVFTVIRNEAWHAAQRYRAGLGYGCRDADVQLEAAGPAVDPCGAADRRLDVQAALSALPPQQRTAVFCTKVLGFTQADTAQAMGSAPGTVATHVSRAVVTLRVTLGALAVVLVGCTVALVGRGGQWLRSGPLPIDPSAGGDVGKALSSVPWQWWLVAATVLTAVLAFRLWQRPVRLPRPPAPTPRAEGEEWRSARPDATGTSSPPWESYPPDPLSSEGGL
ncbi:RNA polymerase sigma factor [Streptomyces sp. NPDC052107]|uniref:RNA polymerase sigma factor n=1 Tax=Streptomyces sp. NPDC052107 TaxID=3155632 RepID=UPI00341E46DB